MKVMRPFTRLSSVLFGAALCVILTGVAAAQNLVVNDPAGGTVAKGEKYTFTVSLDKAPSAPVSVEVAVASKDGGLAKLSPAADSLVFTSSDWDIPQAVVLAAGSAGSVALTPSAAAIAPATVAVNPITALNALSVEPTSVTLSFANNEADENFTAESLTVTEDFPGAPIKVWAYLNNQSVYDMIVVLKLDGTAKLGPDYSIFPLSQKLHIPAGALISTDYATFTILPDYFDEELEETIDISVEKVIASGAPLTYTPPSGANTLKIIIEDDDDPPILSLTVSDTSIPEDGGQAVVTASLSTKSALDVTVKLKITGTASIILDYSLNQAFTGTGTVEDPLIVELTIPARTLETHMVVDAAIDLLDELPETVDIEVVDVEETDLVNATLSPLNDNVSVSITDSNGEDSSAGGSSGGGGCTLGAAGPLSSLLPLLSVLLMAGFMRRRK